MADNERTIYNRMEWVSEVDPSVNSDLKKLTAMQKQVVEGNERIAQSTKDAAKSPAPKGASSATTDALKALEASTARDIKRYKALQTASEASATARVNELRIELDARQQQEAAISALLATEPENKKLQTALEKVQLAIRDTASDLKFYETSVIEAGKSNDVERKRRAEDERNKKKLASELENRDIRLVDSTDTVLSSLGALTGAFDSGAAEAFGFGADIYNVVKTISDFRAALIAGQAATAGATAAEGAAAAGATTLAASLLPIAAVAAAAAAVAAPLVVLALVIRNIDEEAKKAAESTKQYLQLQREASALQREITTLTSEEIAAKREEATQRVLAARAAKEDLQAQREAQLARVGMSEDELRRLGVFGSALQKEVADVITELNAQLAEADKELASASSAVQVYFSQETQQREAIASAAANATSEEQKRIEAIISGSQAGYRATELAKNATRSQLEEQLAANREQQQSVRDTMDALAERRAALESEKATLQEGTPEYAAHVAAIQEVHNAQVGQLEQLNKLESSATDLANAAAMASDEIASLAGQIAALDEDANREIERYKVLRDASSEATEERIKEMEVELAAREKQKAALEELLALNPDSQELKDALVEVSKQISDTTNDLDFYSTEVRAAAKANDDRAAAEEAAKKAQDENTKAIEDAQKELEKAGEDRVKVQKEAAEKERSLLERRNDDIARIEKDYANKLVDAERKRVEDVNKTLLDASRDEQQAARKFADDQVTAQIEYARETEKSERDRQRQILKIQKDAQRAEFDLIASRDFAGLLRQRMDTQQQVTDVTEQANVESQERAIAAQQAQQDMQRQAEIERRERQIQMTQNLQDINDAFTKEREMARVNRDVALAERQAAFNQELADLRQENSIKLAETRKAEAEATRALQVANVQRLQLQNQANVLMMQQGMNFVQGLQNIAARLMAIGGGQARQMQPVANNQVTLNQNISGGASSRQTADTTASATTRALKRVMR